MTRYLKQGSVGLCLCLFLIFGCGSKSPTTPTTDFIAIDSIVPAAGTALTAGERVTFTAVVTCTIVSSSSGFAAMAIQNQGNRSLIPPGESAPLANLVKGTETVTSSHTITVPVSGSTVTVALPIFVSESNTTRAVVTRSYPVR